MSVVAPNVVCMPKTPGSLNIATTAWWVRTITHDALITATSPVTFERGSDYARSGRISQVQATPDGLSMYAVAIGNRGAQYSTEVGLCSECTRDSSAPVWHSWCSCPVERNCKHGVAVVLRAQEILGLTPSARGVGGGAASWESALSGLNVEQEAPQETGFSLALQFSEAPSAQGQQSLHVRPLRQGARGGWVAQGASWREMNESYRRNRLRQDQVDILRELLNLFKLQGGANRYTYSYYGYSLPSQLDLDVLGSGVWPIVRRATTAGVALLLGQENEPVSLRSRPLLLAADLTRQEEELRLRPTLFEPPSTVVNPHEFSLVGQAAHAALLKVDSGWVLSPVEQAAPQLVQLCGRGSGPESLSIPAQDEGRFFGLYLPALQQVAEVLSSDESVEIPEPPTPRLAIEIGYEPHHVVTLTWTFAYGTGPAGGAGATVPLSFSAGGAVRDREAEFALTTRMSEALERTPLPGLVERGSDGQSRPRTPMRLARMDTARFTSDVLPMLLEWDPDELLVTVTGDPMTYEEAPEPPQIVLRMQDKDTSHDWFNLLVEVDVGDERVPLPLLIAGLAGDDDELLLDSGTWFSLRRPELESLRRVLEESRFLVDRDSQSLEFTPYQVDVWDELVALGVVAQQSERWLDAVAGIREPETPVEVPDGLKATLRPYQREGLGWLSRLWDTRLGGVLADDMGLGKTVQVLAAVQRAKERGDLTHPVLVVCPTSVTATWVEEAARFTPGLEVALLGQTGRRRGTTVLEGVGQADVVVTSYTVLRLEEQEFWDIHWGALILDEAQVVKNPSSKTYRSVRRLDTEVTFALSGTPMENSLMDLWAVFSLACPGIFVDPDAFSEVFRKPVEAGDASMLSRLRQRIAPFMLRRTKAAVASDLPPKQEQVLSVDLEPAHRKVYDTHLARERQRILGLLHDDSRQNRVAILAAITKLRQLSLHPALVEPQHADKASAKLGVLVDHIRELHAEGHRALVFSSFTRYLRMVEGALKAAGVETVYLDGRTRDRKARVEQFRQGTAPVFLISLKAGGVGLTLTEADYVFVMDPWWNPAAEQQAIDRTHRIGQTKPVNVYRLISSNTIEERVRQLQERKRDLFEKVVDAGDGVPVSLTDDDIRSLLAG